MAGLAKIGSFTFILGVIISVLVGLAGTLNWITAGTIGIAAVVLVVLGLIVGILNISDKEVTKFIIAAIGLAVGSVALSNILGFFIMPFSAFVSAAVFLPALKAIYSISKD
jgi:hypothetical protein